MHSAAAYRPGRLTAALGSSTPGAPPPPTTDVEATARASMSCSARDSAIAAAGVQFRLGAGQSKDEALLLADAQTSGGR